MEFEIRDLPREAHAEVIVPLATALGFAPRPEAVARNRDLAEMDVRIGAFDDGALVGGMASYSLEMTVPGGAAVPTAALTAVGVLPTHRRRGALTKMMRRYLDAARERGQVLSALWASEGAIYGRYGYGLASLCGEVSVPTEHGRFAREVPRDAGRARIVSEADAARLCPEVWERVRPTRPGMLSRSSAWWTQWKLADPEWARAGGGLLQRVVLEVDGCPEAYALYRHHGRIERGVFSGTLRVLEAVSATPLATRLLWRYLLDVDLVERVEAALLPVDHPLLLLVPEARRLGFTLGDALWVRVLDVPRALSSRRWGSSDTLVLEVRDAFCPWNAGRYALDGGRGAGERTDAAADLTLDASALGAAWLGAMLPSRLAEAGWIEAHTPDALARADALFRGDLAPWCPEVF